jgi:hypothetical protein
MNGVSRGIVAALAREYGISRRTPAEFRPPLPADRDWLYEQYVTRSRTLPDIAAELGTSNSSVTRRLRALDIPFRGQAARQHRSPSPAA